MAGIRNHLDYLQLLGVQTLWLNPIFGSPGVDGGYDVSDPRGVDPMFGTLADFDELIADAHSRDVRLIVDLIPNHVSSAHPWFVRAVADGAGSAARQRFWFRPGRGDNGAEPPNNWRSVFGGSAWTRVPDGEWYLHLFDPGQPDLDWNSLDVWADLEQTLRFWLDRNVDGFRIDVAHGMAKPADLPDARVGHQAAVTTERVNGLLPYVAGEADPRFDNVGVHDVHRFIRRIVDSYDDRTTVGEVFTPSTETLLAYLRPDELRQAFGFQLTQAPFDADAIRAAIDTELGTAHAAGTAAVWTLSNHDIPRPATRYGGGAAGLRRARAMLLVELALPGAVYLYYGEELGLPDVAVPDDCIQDPAWVRSGHAERGRDAIRLPMPWGGNAPPFSFSTSDDTWLPSPPQYASLTVARQLADPTSTLSLVRRALELRASEPAMSGDDLDWYGAPAGCLAFRRGGGLVCAMCGGSG